MTATISYQVNTAISPEQFITVLKGCSLGERRPLDNAPVIKGMLDNANLLVTAWAGNDLVDSDLVGVARCVTDFSYCCYLSDIAVLDSYQHQGIGKMLIQKIEEQLPPTCKIILLSAPQAVDYYPKIGFTQHNSAWVKAVNKA